MIIFLLICLFYSILSVESSRIRFHNGDYLFVNHILEPSHRPFLRFNAPPPGSWIEFEMNRHLSDPISHSPWEYETSVLKSERGFESPSYRFLKNDWGYLDHYNDPNQPAGVIEGGPQNYEGKGLALKGGKDRMRTEYLPYHLDHGVEYRQRVKAGSISYDVAPTACQDFVYNENDLQMERKQWGSWDQVFASPTCQMSSAFRSHVEADNLTDIPYGWLYNFELFEKLPLHRTAPTPLIPSPHPDLRLAALNRFAGYIPRPANQLTTEEALVRQKRLLKEWNRLEALYKKTNDPKLLEEINRVKFTLFPVPDMSDSEDEIARIVFDHAINRARELMQKQVNNWRADPEVIEYHLLKLYNGPLEPSSDYRGPEKTVALNMVNHRPISKKFRQFTTIEEMAEVYHALITENRREGRSHMRTHMISQKEIKEYPLRKYRKNFPALEAEYRPIWMNRGYGSEFGDAIRKSQRIPEHLLGEFGSPLRKKRRRLTKEERKKNFRDDYGWFGEEYNY